MKRTYILLILFFFSFNFSNSLYAFTCPSKRAYAVLKKKGATIFSRSRTRVFCLNNTSLDWYDEKGNKIEGLAYSNIDFKKYNNYYLLEEKKEGTQIKIFLLKKERNRKTLELLECKTQISQQFKCSSHSRILAFFKRLSLLAAKKYLREKKQINSLKDHLLKLYQSFKSNHGKQGNHSVKVRGKTYRVDNTLLVDIQRNRYYINNKFFTFSKETPELNSISILIESLLDNGIPSNEIKSYLRLMDQAADADAFSFIVQNEGIKTSQFNPNKYINSDVYRKSTHTFSVNTNKKTITRVLFFTVGSLEDENKKQFLRIKTTYDFKNNIFELWYRVYKAKEGLLNPF